jgi:hypothetical protein
MDLDLLRETEQETQDLEDPEQTNINPSTFIKIRMEFRNLPTDICPPSM